MYDDYKVSDDLKSMMNNERIVWSGRPKKSCFVLECIFNPMLIFAGIWFLFDFVFIAGSLSADYSGGNDAMFPFIIGFFYLTYDACMDISRRCYFFFQKAEKYGICHYR